MATKKKTLLPKVTSLAELEQLAKTDPRYAALALAAAENLGSAAPRTLEAAMRWLRLNAAETTERGVVGEVNYCRDLVETVDEIEALMRETLPPLADAIAKKLKTK